jgi:Tol biopolymer transport system component
MRVDGSAVALDSNLHMSAEDETGAAGYDVSDDGILAFAPPAGYGAAGPTRLLFQSLDGNETPLPIDVRPFGSASLSPDDRRVVAHINDVEGTHIWVLDVDRRSVQRLTSTGRNTYPAWSHDGSTIYFASDRDGDTDIWRRPADLSSPAEKVLAAEGAQLPTAVTQDGQWLICSWMTPGNSDIARVSLVGEPDVEILVEGPADESNAKPSADGRFICYQSDETGRWDIHVTEIATGRRWIVSSVEGFFPFWTRDGNHIMYRVGSQGSLSLDVTTAPQFSTTTPVPVFEFDAARQVQMFDVTSDGQQALIGAREHQDSSAETRPRVVVDLNWFAKLPEQIGG